MILALSQSMCWPPASQESEVTQLQASADSALLARTLRQEYGYQEVLVANVEYVNQDPVLENNLFEDVVRDAIGDVHLVVGVVVEPVALALALAFLAVRAATRCSSRRGSSLRE